jgi:hypothetical protein
MFTVYSSPFTVGWAAGSRFKVQGWGIIFSGLSFDVQRSEFNVQRFAYQDLEVGSWELDVGRWMFKLFP